MATTVHLPQTLLERLDARAKALQVSRNRLIVDTLSTALGADEGWSAEFLGVLENPLGETEAAAVEEMTVAIRERRTRKAPPEL
jgi:metal-responsive CopG/Arc/MetJ family transcriptional regulator